MKSKACKKPTEAGSFLGTTQRYSRGNSPLHSHCHKNLKPNKPLTVATYLLGLHYIILSYIARSPKWFAFITPNMHTTDHVHLILLDFIALNWRTTSFHQYTHIQLQLTAYMEDVCPSTTML
jgi:hypothetical protein